jgi:hypothetical protein
VNDLPGSCGRRATRIGESGGDIVATGCPAGLASLFIGQMTVCLHQRCRQVTAVCQAQPWSGRVRARTLVISPLRQEAMVRVCDWADVRSGGCGKPPAR